MKVITLVRFRPDVPRAEAWRAWAAHTREWDARDHPTIVSTTLTLFAPPAAGSAGYDGMALTEWQNEAAFREAAAWYSTPQSAAHAADLARFLSMDDMLSLELQDECVIPGAPR